MLCLILFASGLASLLLLQSLDQQLLSIIIFGKCIHQTLHALESMCACIYCAGFQPAGVKMFGGSSNQEKVLVFPARDQIKYIDVRVGSG
jgi:hypothetical protein